MFREAFEKLELDDVATVLDKVNPLLEGIVFDPIETVIMGIDLSFYPGYRLLDISDYSGMPASHRYAVCSPRSSVVLNFTNAPIYKMNADVPLVLNEDTVADYVRFFFAFVRGKHGRFRIAESIDDIFWKEDPPPAARKAIGKMITPVTLVKKGEDGTYHLQASLMFKDSLFRSNITVLKGGVVNLTDEELLVEDMPVLDDTFGQ